METLDFTQDFLMARIPGLFCDEDIGHFPELTSLPEAEWL
jgi:hypothetical protein